MLSILSNWLFAKRFILKSSSFLRTLSISLSLSFDILVLSTSVNVSRSVILIGIILIVHKVKSCTCDVANFLDSQVIEYFQEIMKVQNLFNALMVKPWHSSVSTLNSPDYLTPYLSGESHECEDVSRWPDALSMCGHCKVLAENMERSCAQYCNLFGHVCTNAWEGESETCKVKNQEDCQKIMEENAICECRKQPGKM